MYTTDEQASASTTGMIVAVALMVVMSGVVYAGLSTRMDEQTDAETTIERASVDIVSQNQLRVVPVIGSRLDLDSTTVRVTFPNSDKRGFTVTNAGQAITHSETATETTTRTVTNGLEPEPVYEPVTRPVYETVRKRVRTGTEPVERIVPTYRWNRTVTTERPIHRWNRTVTEQVPQYRWHHEWTERVPRYRWERTVTDRETTVDWKSPGSGWSRTSGVLYTDSVYKGWTRERVRTGYETQRRLVDIERERVRTGYETHEECSAEQSLWGFTRGRNCETVREPVYGYERTPVFETVRQPIYEWRSTTDYDIETFHRYERLDRTTEQTLSATEPAGEGWQKMSRRAFAHTRVTRTDSEVAATPPAPGWTRKSAAVVSHIERTRTETTLAAESPGDGWHRVSDAPVRTDVVEQTQTQIAPRQPGESWSPVSSEPVGETTLTTTRPTYGIVEQRIRTGTTTQRVISRYRMVPKTTVVTETETTARFDDSVTNLKRAVTDQSAGVMARASIAAADENHDGGDDETGQFDEDAGDASDRYDDGRGPPAHVLDRLPFLSFDETDGPPARASSIVKGLSGTTTRGSQTAWQNGESITVHLHENHIEEGDIVRVEVIDTNAEAVVIDKQVRATNLPTVSLDNSRPAAESPPPTAPPSTDAPATPATAPTTTPANAWSGGTTDRPPAVSIFGPNTVPPGSETTFEANAVDDNGIAGYSWHGAYSYDQSTATHTFADAPGETRRISLTVTDTAGQTATATKVVEISDDNRDPQIDLPPAVTGCVGDTVRLNPTITTEEGDTATGEWDRAMPIQLDSPGVSSVTYTATDNHGGETYHSVRITAMSCDGEREPAESEVGGGSGNEVMVLSGTEEMSQTAGAEENTIKLRDGISEIDGSGLIYAASGFLSMGDKATDAIAPDSYTIKTEVTRETAERLTTEAEAARDLSFGEGSNIATNRHKTLTNVQIENGLDPGPQDKVTVFVKIAPGNEVNGAAIAAKHGDVQNTGDDSSTASHDTPPIDTASPTVSPPEGITEAVTRDQADNLITNAASGRVLAVQNEQIRNFGAGAQISDDSEDSSNLNQQDSATSDTEVSQSVQDRREAVLQNDPLAAYYRRTADDDGGDS